jgi:hypothetical protein
MHEGTYTALREQGRKEAKGKDKFRANIGHAKKGS